MLKKLLSLTLVLTIVLSMSLTGCGQKNNTENGDDNQPSVTDDNNQDTEDKDTSNDNEQDPDTTQDNIKPEKEKATIPVAIGMVTDSGTIDDKSFNQGTWEGIELYQEHTKSDIQYIKPDGESKTDYLKSIGDLVDGEYQIIVTPGYKFEEAIYEAQDKYPNTKFILIDGIPIPKPDDYGNAKVADNTVSVFFTEHESGFLAGIATALESKSGKVGFIGGMEIPPVQKYGWGFAAGIAYANKVYNTNVTVQQYIYQGTFYETEAGKALAGGMYDQGIDIIFAAAGGVGGGAINEAKERTVGGSTVYIVGVDVNQYADGIYEGDKSVILTSAMKRIDNAAYDHIKLFSEDKFQGGQSIIMNIKNDGVGLPKENPNLAEETVAKVEEIKEKMIAGEVVVPDNAEGLDAFLSEQGYTTPEGVKY